MKITLIFRDGVESRFIASQVCETEKKVQVIIETGKVAKLNKLKRTFPMNKIYLWPKRLLDLVSLLIYESLFTNYLRSKIDDVKLDSFLKIDDVNEDRCLSAVKKYNADIIIVFGTAIIRERFLTQIKKPIYNIHTGILPKYRNVHSEFWAYKNKDYKNIGVTIIHIDKGIDSGAIALQKTVRFTNNDTLFSTRVKTFKLIVPLIRELLKAQKNERVPKIKQDDRQSGYFRTPGTLQLLQYLFRELKPATR